MYLIDHGTVDCFETHLEPFIRGVLDHHEDKGSYDHLSEFKDVRFCGAAVSILVSHILADGLEEIFDEDTKYFASAPIIIDTKNFSHELYKKKWTDFDQTTYKKILPNENQQEYFEKLWFLKSDEE